MERYMLINKKNRPGPEQPSRPKGRAPVYMLIFRHRNLTRREYSNIHDSYYQAVFLKPNEKEEKYYAENHQTLPSPEIITSKRGASTTGTLSCTRLAALVGGGRRVLRPSPSASRASRLGVVRPLARAARTHLPTAAGTTGSATATSCMDRVAICSRLGRRPRPRPSSRTCLCRRPTSAIAQCRSSGFQARLRRRDHRLRPSR